MQVRSTEFGRCPTTRYKAYILCPPGKSTLLNRILDWQRADDSEPMKKRAGNQNARKGTVTTSPLPGTTLKFIEVSLGDGQKIIDTPGLLVNGTLTQLLTPAELKIVVPQK